ncbi:hypothetical protein AB0O01_02985 [Streptomyces sp. NPDC093252]|uniref:hypothetical protein n=1 Tax=Streptomyces sp. NPDC093252 TaxID=3154980 RepID=UPI003439739B
MAVGGRRPVRDSLAFAPLGLLAAGPAADAHGTGTALVGCAILVVVATGAALLSPAVRTLRAPAPAPIPVPEG